MQSDLIGGVIFGWGGYIRRVSSLERNNSVAFYYINIHLKCGPISGVSSLKGNNLVAFYNINTHLKSDLTGVWPYKRGVLS